MSAKGKSKGTGKRNHKACFGNNRDEKLLACNAGVVLVGFSAQHGGQPAILVGGRFYTRKGEYRYTDFGGGVEQSETPQQGAFREFAEELLSQKCNDASATARALENNPSVVFGKRIHTNGYHMFVTHADEVVKVLGLPPAADGMSGIDRLFAQATQNEELSSVALVSIEELLRGVSIGEKVRPLSVRRLDYKKETESEIYLRSVFAYSISSIWTVLEDFASQKQKFSNPGKGRPWQSSSGGVPVLACPLAATASSPAEPLAAPQARPYVFDMETGDPDDVMTLLLLAGDPSVDLRAVTITPGSRDQVSLVRWLLEKVGLTNVMIGATDWPINANEKVSLAGPFYESFGRLRTTDDDCRLAADVLRASCNKDTTLITGGPLHNLEAALRTDGFTVGRWVAQGGFAGEGVVPRQKQMAKFRGNATTRTFNFGSNPGAAQVALKTRAISRKILCSKNVCHRVVYDPALHQTLGDAVSKTPPSTRRGKALKMLHDAMSKYLPHYMKREPDGKKLHDPLAMVVAFDESVCEWAQVDMYMKRCGWCKGGCSYCEWGATLQPTSQVQISIDYDDTKFRKILVGGSIAAQQCPAGNCVDASPPQETKSPQLSVQPSHLTKTDKEFLKLAKKYREIRKLEELDASTLAKNQREKMEAKGETLAELRSLLRRMPNDSEVLSKNADILVAVNEV